MRGVPHPQDSPGDRYNASFSVPSEPTDRTALTRETGYDSSEVTPPIRPSEKLGKLSLSALNLQPEVPQPASVAGDQVPDQQTKGTEERPNHAYQGLPNPLPILPRVSELPQQKTEHSEPYTAEELLSTALRAADEHVTLYRPPSKHIYSESPASDKKDAVNQRAGRLLASQAYHAADMEEYLVCVEAIQGWLENCNVTHTERSDYPIPTAEVHNALLSKIIEAGWVNNLDDMQIAVKALIPLYRAPSGSGRNAANLFATAGRVRTEGMLKSLKDYENIHLDLSLISAMTDAGVIDENAWGKAGIEAFKPDTPFALTEETHRRFVLEQRDAYAPVSILALTDTIGRYCLNLFTQITKDPSRHTDNMAKIATHLNLSHTTETGVSLKKLVDLSNIITAARNKHDGQDPRSQQELLEPRSRAVVGEALNRILAITRSPGSAQNREQQAYRDSIHVEIVHELSLFGADLQRLTKPT